MKSTTSRTLGWSVALVVGGFLTLGVAQFPTSDWCKFQEPWYILLFLCICVPTVIAFSRDRNVSTRILLLIPLLLFFSSSRFTSERSAAEGNAFGTLKKTSAYLQSYAAAHPNSGYPESIAPISCPCRARGYYSFQYRAERSKPNSILDRYTVLATATRPSDRIRSFLITEEGKVLYTTENRPATRSDKPLE